LAAVLNAHGIELRARGQCPHGCRVDTIVEATARSRGCCPRAALMKGRPCTCAHSFPPPRC
jgi:hypothetical protein